MRLSEAESLIEATTGYLVHFERIEGVMLASDYTPAITEGEEPFATAETAWDFAAKLAKAMKGRAVNFYVTKSIDFTPVPDYQNRKIANR